MFDCLCIKNMHVVAFSFGKTALLKYCFLKKFVVYLFSIIEHQNIGVLMVSNSCILGAITITVQPVLLNI